MIYSSTPVLLRILPINIELIMTDPYLYIDIYILVYNGSQYWPPVFLTNLVGGEIDYRVLTMVTRSVARWWRDVPTG